jgi:uncharacterized protein YndB with AHSA1/START domain
MNDERRSPAERGAARPPARDGVMARVTRRFRSPPARLFDAWLDPAKVQLWLAAAARKEALGELVGVELDARVGGAFRFVCRRGSTELVQSGTYLEIERPRRLVFSWDMALPDIERIVIQITATADGSELVLDHVMDAAWSGDVSPVTAAWASVAEALGELLG